MNKEFTCYCGLSCELCAVKVKVFPAAKTLYQEMVKTGFDSIVKTVPDGNAFWGFLEVFKENWACTSCRDGSGNPECKIRICALEKSVEMCAFCNDYPCDKISSFDAHYPNLKNDNDLLRCNGWDAWSKLLKERQKDEYTYTD